MKVQLQILISALDTGEWSTSLPRRGENYIYVMRKPEHSLYDLPATVL
jgi:hypothetical protein